ncbi:glycine betaine ABC transporter substrate-binding protein [Dactylosporangium sp. NPDC049742]|uniref:glycine betaine ABC transporter substrate-binding protein n=1 Tax=Dactylosporangium sp. NPDC049742 TaxID=3154737 RepID=UPI0034292928
MRRDGVVAAVVQQLDLVSTALDTRKLAGLNRRIEADHAAPADVAQEFAAANGLTKKVDLRITYGLTIGTTGLPEQQVVAHLYRISLEAAGYRTTVRTLADRAALHVALTSGSVTLAPEYTGSYAAFLNDRARGEFAHACSGTATVLGGPAECPAGFPCRQSLADVYALRPGAFTELPDRGPAARAALTGGTVSLALISSSDPAFA